MTYDEFRKLGLPGRILRNGVRPGWDNGYFWCIFKPNQEDKGIIERELDFSAPKNVKDGPVPITTYSRAAMDFAVVKDGQFVIGPTIMAIDKVNRACRSNLEGRPCPEDVPIDHVYVEKLRLCSNGVIEVCLGS